MILKNHFETLQLTKDNLLWSLTLVNLILLVFNYWALYQLALTFATGLNIWAGMILLLAGPLALATCIHAILKPIKTIQAIVNGIFVMIYIWFWVRFLA